MSSRLFPNLPASPSVRVCVLLLLAAGALQSHELDACQIPLRMHARRQKTILSSAARPAHSPPRRTCLLQSAVLLRAAYAGLPHRLATRACLCPYAIPPIVHAGLPRRLCSQLIAHDRQSVPSGRVTTCACCWSSRICAHAPLPDPTAPSSRYTSYSLVDSACKRVCGGLCMSVCTFLFSQSV